MKNITIADLIDKPISGEWGEDPKADPIIKVIRNTNFTNEGKLDLANVVDRSISQKKIECKSLKKGDIIIEKSGGSPNQPVGRVVYYDQNDGEYLFSNFTSSLRPKDNVHPRYLFYLLFAHHKYNTTLSFQNKTTGIINLQLARYLKSVTIPFPPLENQKKIAAILDKVDVLVQNDKKILEKYDHLAQSIFLEMFGDPISNENGWELYPLSELLEFLTSGSRGWAKYYSESGDVFLRIQNIGYNYLKLEDLTYVRAPDSAESRRTRVQEGDVILSITADLGRTGVIPRDFPKAHINQHLAILRLKDGVLPYYISQFITSSGGQIQLRRRNKGGVKAGLNFDDIRSILIPQPPIDLQRRYLEIIKNVDRQKQISKDSLLKNEELFQSFLQRAFKGELV